MQAEGYSSQDNLMRASDSISNGYSPDTDAVSLKRTCTSYSSFLDKKIFFLPEEIEYKWKAVMAFFTHNKGQSRHSCKKLHPHKGEHCTISESQQQISKGQEKLWSAICDWTMVCGLKKTDSGWGRNRKVRLLRVLFSRRPLSTLG